MKTQNTHNRKKSTRLLRKSHQTFAKTSTWQHTTLTTNRHPYDSSVNGISTSHRTVPDNTQHSQQTDIHRTPLYKWSARRRDHYLTINKTHNRQTYTRLLCKRDQPGAHTSTWQHTSHNRQTSTRLLCKRDQPVAQTSTWQHTTHNRQISKEHMCTSDQPVAQTSTWQHITLTTDRYP